MPQVTIDQAMQIAVQHHQAGRLQEAEQLYRQILAQLPGHAPAMHHLGIIAHQVGRHDLAIDLIRRAIALRPGDAEAHGNLATVLKERGSLDEAIASYRLAISLRPGYADAYCNLGMALRDKGQFDEAMAAYRQAIALVPGHCDAHFNLGNALKDRGKLDEAIAAYRQAINLRPGYADALNNLGIALADNGQFDDAIAAYCRSLALNPNDAEVHTNYANALLNNGQPDPAIDAYRRAIVLNPKLAEAYCGLGDALKDKGEFRQAIAACRQAISLKPEFVEAFNKLGNMFYVAGQLEEAIAAYRRAIILRPGYAEAHNNLGNALKDCGNLDEAIAACDRALALDPELAESHCNIGNVFKDKGQMDDAIAAYRRAIVIRPSYAKALSNLGNALKDRGELPEAIATYRRAIALQPDLPEAHSNLILAMHFASDQTLAIADEHRRWNQAYADPVRNVMRPSANDGPPGRRLRIGYLSPDFRQHAVGRFVLPLLANHDKSGFEIFAYAQVPRPDAMTQRLQSYADHWRSIVGLPDARVAELIRSDQIDILMDLAMHSANNRLPVFAHKPAPVQVTWLAYCSTTGLETIDYRLSDPYLDPPGADESFYTEQTIRLPETYWCYEPGVDLPEAGPLPAREHGHITFGCLNNFCKISDGALATWIQLLQDVPGSRLLLHAREGSHRQRVKEQMARAGLDADRLEFADLLPAEQYFNLYRQIDVALDTFPYGGGTTTCDALWMGVPVVSLTGKTAVGRGGVSILTNVGLPELIAHSQADYLRLAKELASDLPRLSDLRSSLRKRMEQSPLMDAPRFARNVESAYREMWRRNVESPLPKAKGLG